MSKITPRVNLQSMVIFLFWSCIIASTFVMMIDLTPKISGWPHWDKVQHIVGFSVFTTLGCFAYVQKKTEVCIALIVYGALVEYAQSALTATRTASLGDWLADIFGVAIGIAVYVMIKNLRRKNTSSFTSSAV